MAYSYVKVSVEGLIYYVRVVQRVYPSHMH